MIVLSFDGNFKPSLESGAYGVVIVVGKKTVYLCQKTEQTTRTREELKGLVKGLQYIDENIEAENTQIMVYGDSRYVLDSASKLIFEWVKTDFRNGKILNIDLWKDYVDVVASLGRKKNSFVFFWVKAHTKFWLNEKAIELAQRASTTLKRYYTIGREELELSHSPRLMKKLAECTFPADFSYNNRAQGKLKL